MRSHVYAQHFLKSPRLVAELIGHSNLRKNDTVLDLGAGSGIIASVLARRVRDVIAVEIEPKTVELLRENLAKFENVKIVERDIEHLQLPTQPYKVFSNIPFSLSSIIVRKLVWASNPPVSIYLIVQKQFARKITPSDKHFTSQLGAEIAPWWQARIRRPLKRNDFTPPPAVDTVLLELKPRSETMLASKYQESYRQFVEQCYSRQDFFTNLARHDAGIQSERKPSELTPEQWVKLYAISNS